MLLLHWLVVFAGFAGLGSLLLQKDRDSQYGVFDAFWAGVFLASGLLQVLQLWSPMRPGFALALVSVGVAVTLKSRLLSRVRLPAAAFVMLPAFAVWAIMASLNEPPQADFGFYHLPSVR